jgi:predicted RNase H-like HicB family nuclease
MKKKVSVNGREYVAIVNKGDKWYVAECPTLHSFTQGRTVTSALEHLKEVSELMIEEKHGRNSYSVW